MKTKDLIKLGSQTAKSGFKNEKDIVKKFNNWKGDENVQVWLGIMGYPPDEIEKVEAIIIPGHYKADVQVQITVYLKEVIAAENLSVKLVSNPQGFNQIDKRRVDKYIEMWDIPEDIANILKSFTGEIKPVKTGLKDSRRMLLNEMSQEDQEKIVNFFKKNKILIVSDVLKGRDKFSAGWILVALVVNGKSKWILKSINQAMNVFGDGPVRIGSRGSLKIGQIGMQRKGGDNGKPSANMLQFKINPVLLFDK